jgi:uncharacterized protein HemX
MKWFIFAAFAAVLTWYFANENLQEYALVVVQDGKYKIVAHSWHILAKLWPVWLILILGIGVVTALVLYFFSNEEEKMQDEFENKLKKAEKDYQKQLSDIEKMQASQIENLFHAQTTNGNHLQNAYAETARIKQKLEQQEDENALLINRIKGKDAVILRLEKKIKKLEKPRF